MVEPTIGNTRRTFLKRLGGLSAATLGAESWGFTSLSAQELGPDGHPRRVRHGAQGPSSMSRS